MSKRKLWHFLRCFSFLMAIAIVSKILASFERKLEFKDWNDYDLMKRDLQRVGFGEHGKGEVLREINDINENERLFEENGMFVLVSDKISVNRSIPDFRHENCLKKKYYAKLPRISIIIIFNDEIFSVFKRTLHSLYNRTPHELVKEVILVNDNSSKEYLYSPLRIYIEEHFPQFKFHIINLNQRHGLMQARVIGAKAAKSEFLFIMEPHCEMTYNWLPPLLQPHVEKERIVTVPIVDNIEWKELYYYENDRGQLGSRGVFDWNLEYFKLNRFPTELDKSLDPFLIPIMTGGIFMIRKNYFFEIGPYDKELLIWGAENIEMSLKINLCGGNLLEVPCSHIGHVFRAFTKSRKHESGIDFETFNRKRIVEVWFDEYKEYVYMRHRSKYDSVDVGDLAEAKKVKKSLNCKPFKYFIEHIAPDLTKTFPLIEVPFAYGQIKLHDHELCIELDDSEEKFKTKLNQCEEQQQSTNKQFFELSWYRDIRVKESNLCIDAYELSIANCRL